MPHYDEIVRQLNAANSLELRGGDSVEWMDGLRIPKDWFNPYWLKRCAEWRLFRICYTGGREFLCSSNPITLFSHEREDDESYADRRRRSFYRNHVETLIGVKSDAIYQPQVLRGQEVAEKDEDPADASLPPAVKLPREPGAEPEKGEPRVPIRKHEADPSFEPWTRNVDGAGTNADPFWNEIARWSMAQGDRWVEIANAPAPPALAARLQKDNNRRATAAEAKEFKLGCVLRSVPPEAVIDWDYDERGALKFALIMSCEKPRVPLQNQYARRTQPQKARLVARLLLPDREERYLVGERGGLTLLSVHPHNFGEVPLVRVQVRSDGRSEIEDIAPMAIAVHNYDALIDEQIYRSTFNQMVGKVKDRDKFLDNVTGSLSLMTIGLDESLEYLSPNTDTITTIQARATEILDEMYAMANLRSRNGGKGTQPAVDQSGIAYAFEAKNAETDLANTATRLEEAELKILKMRDRAMGLDEDGAIVQYPRQFDVRAIQARAAEHRSLKEAGVPDLALAEGLKDLVRKAWPRLTAAKLAAVDAQIDALAAAGKLSAMATAAKPVPPNQSNQPPGAGASEDRMKRALKPDDEADDDELEFEEEK